MSEYRRQIAVGAVVALVATIGFAFVLETTISNNLSAVSSSTTLTLPSNQATTSAILSSTISGANETIYIHVVNSSDDAALPNQPVLAEPANPPDAAQRLNLCWYDQPGGSAIVNTNGTALLDNGTLASVPPCPLDGLTTNSTGWVTITNQVSTYFYIQVGGISFNSGIVALDGSHVTYVAAAYPTGDLVASAAGTWTVMSKNATVVGTAGGLACGVLRIPCALYTSTSRSNATLLEYGGNFYYASTWTVGQEGQQADHYTIWFDNSTAICVSPSTSTSSLPTCPPL